MFIIFGAPRSGTTLLSASLDQHPDIVIPDESDFIVPLAFICARIPDEVRGKELAERFILSSERFQDHLGPFLSPDKISRAISEAPYRLEAILDSLYGLVAESAKKKISGDKSPNDLMGLRILAKAGLFDGSLKVIHMVRDIRDVMSSLLKTGWIDGIEQTFPRAWAHANLELGETMKKYPERYCFIRYEDLVREPEQQLRRVTEFLGVPFDPAVLSWENRGPRYQQFGHHQNISEPITTARVGAWKKELDPKFIYLCETQARAGLAEFGYGIFQEDQSLRLIEIAKETENVRKTNQALEAKFRENDELIQMTNNE